MDNPPDSLADNMGEKTITSEDCSLITPLPASPLDSPALSYLTLSDEGSDVDNIGNISDRYKDRDALAEGQHDANSMDHNADEVDIDVLGSTDNLYRILELITEQGSGGLVDKIIIAQDSLREFINQLSPNAYTSLTKVDFKALDLVTVQPVGVYGPKEALVLFLSDLGILDESRCQKLLGEEDSSSMHIQSGLYAAQPHANQVSGVTQIYIIFWPEQTTWDDNAPSAVRRNRVTFMRYLNKITDQTLCLLSENISKLIIWNDDSNSTDLVTDIEDDYNDRLFSFEVSKTREQEENVTIRDGFHMSLARSLLNHRPGNRERDLEPILLRGETAQGFLTAKYVEPSPTSSQINGETFNLIQLRELFATGTIILEPDFPDHAMENLIQEGLSMRFPQICAHWKNLKSMNDRELEASKEAKRKQSEKELEESSIKLQDVIFLEFFERLKKLYPAFVLYSIGEKCAPLEKGLNDSSDPFSLLVRLYPQIGKEFDQLFKKLEKINVDDYRKYKKQLITIQICLEAYPEQSGDERQKMIQMIFDGADLNQLLPQAPPSIIATIFNLLLPFKSAGQDDIPRRISNRATRLLDPTFLATFKDDLSLYGGPIAQEIVVKIIQLASQHLERMVNKSLPAMVNIARRSQLQMCHSQIDIILAGERQQRYRDLRLGLARDLQNASQTVSDERRVLSLSKLEINVPTFYSSHSHYPAQGSSFKVTAKVKTRTEPFLEYKINILELTSEHRQNLQLDQTFIPTPLVNERFSSSFRLPPEHVILHSQLLPSDKLLLVVDDRRDTISVFCDTLHRIGNGIQGNRPRKVVHREKTGKDVIIAFDETKRILAFYASSKCLLYIFVFDESFDMLTSWANAINLLPWHEAGQQIFHLCFVTGNEELLLVDNHGQARIFSLITQQCRPASLKFLQLPEAILPTPDGACFLAVFVSGGGRTIRAYHWATFGSNNGIAVNVDLKSGDMLSLTSFVNKTNVQLLLFDVGSQQCRSVVFDITKKSTEFMFQEKSAHRDSNGLQVATVHNCLLDCHYDMWTRFPVVPAVQRQTKTSSAIPCPKMLLFATNGHHDCFSLYFAKMIKTFEQKTRKPTGDELRSILVNAVTFGTLKDEFMANIDKHISCFRSGEWLVDLLCLIPIHIAITRENRFIPLKDGVTSATYEKSLLGAEVSSVVDSISFGWYESILQSYMSTKPVKVVSSMGEQSVGKSYALNHLVDTSFAGSAMRTTEGVWMSVTPTDEALLVALDFEGVHSIERSAQEDTLLVLFNTAISNLVLFRNNFALSRDITGLFQSFQSSSSVFDPAANPTLFRSTLAIIIKDVVDSDKKEIVREFSLKFQKIVQDEQESNFISRLHAGQLKIIPWPVIESKQFYALFPAIKTVLDKQLVTHQTAGSFLHTLKTLMAKLKANDWRALSQSMAAHRVHQLLLMLPNALAFGYAELEPHPEELKDFDTDTVISFADTPCRLFLSALDSQHGERDAHLRMLCESWAGYQFRHQKAEKEWVEELSAYIIRLVDTRVNHVNIWISKNLENFQTTTQASITALNRTLNATIIDIRANVELCKQLCSSCQLHCILSRRHGDKPHDCLTSHKCIQECNFAEEHPERLKFCGYPAGHSGKHVCVVEDHLCGEPCILKDKAGCLGECTQVASHKENDHRCSARIHFCGKPCQLLLDSRSSTSDKGPSYRCPGTCTISSDVEHEHHTCENRMCPLQCQLCKRLCASDNHLHALDTDAIHLCGEIHSCQALCSPGNGICEIDTMPQSIEAMFTGQHSTFQYTKYSQVAKRLQCAIPIPTMALRHSGKHCHSTEANPFHFCEARCSYCSYYCTLPRGHSQQEHETSHGSMSRSRWAVEKDDAVLELNGRKFGSDDDGAPMMCNLFCQEMGRHVHIDYCRADSDGNCNGQDLEHIRTRINPNPDRPKDWITHELFWKRSGFKDPYSRDDRTNFAKCDAMCAGPEHLGTASNPSQPSYCTLPMFHPPHAPGQGVGLGYASNDGHLFSCKNPALMQQAFHVIFVIDRSGSMSESDRRPLAGTPVSARIIQRSNNRLGAVYSSLYGFWMSRVAAISTAQNPQLQALRRDAYSVVLFDHTTVKCIENDFTNSPEQLIDVLLRYETNGGTDYALAVKCAEEVMRRHWSTERVPVVIFLSDGECGLDDSNMQTLCRAAVALGKPLSFHGVSFGPNNQVLRRMVQIAREIQASVPPDPLIPAVATVESSFAEALDSVRLAETFLGIAESLKKPRGSLFT